MDRRVSSAPARSAGGRAARALSFVLLVGLLGLAAAGCLAIDEPAAERPEKPDVAELRLRTGQVDDLDWLGGLAPDHPWLRPGLTRTGLARDKQVAVQADDPVAVARLSGLLAAEAQTRAAQVLERWAQRVDPETGLLPKGVDSRDQVWDYADAGADLYPHLLIAATLLRPELAPPLRQVIASERALAGQLGVPPDVDLTTNLQQQDDLDDRIFGGVEYGKDGLLPLTERLGAGPWLDRLREVADAVEAQAPLNSRFGRLPSDESEVNGQVLQILARLYWATGEERYFAMARPLARAYLEEVLPKTRGVPPRTWDFRRGRLETDQAQLRDHGNEVVAGLIEFHLIETLRGEPEVALHRSQIRAMLDRLLQIGRNPDGLWKSTIDLDSGESLKDTLSDNWGYLYAAYLTQALIETELPGGDPRVAERYRAAAEAGLAAAARLEFYPWQGVEQDGYADTVESALYLLNRLPSTAAEGWVDRQIGTLFGAQEDGGRVEDRYLDGNFVRTALLYAAWQTRGARVDPWAPGVMLGAAPDDGCLQLAAAVDRDWEGRLIFDAPRHRLHLGLTINYPRLNEWPEWFAAEPAGAYVLTDSGQHLSGVYRGAELIEGLPIRLAGGSERELRICPVDQR